MLSDYKWRFLVLCIFVVFPIYYVYFFPILFKTKLEFQFYDHFQQNSQNFEIFYNLLFAFYTLPNIFLPLFKAKILRNGKLKVKLLFFFLFIYACFIDMMIRLFVYNFVSNRQHIKNRTHHLLKTSFC